MITFEQIQKANETIRTMGIEKTNRKTGQTTVTQYAEVNQRIKAFRMVYPEGFIVTNMESNENGVCIIRASVGCYDENGDAKTLGTGTAYEKEDSSFINKTSYIENCETSAVGRALGMAGFGIDTSVASYEEVANAIENQNKKVEKASEKDLAYIATQCTDEELKKWISYYKVNGIEDFTASQASTIIRRINARKMERAEV